MAFELNVTASLRSPLTRMYMRAFAVDVDVYHQSSAPFTSSYLQLTRLIRFDGWRIDSYDHDTAVPCTLLKRYKITEKKKNRRAFTNVAEKKKNS